MSKNVQAGALPNEALDVELTVKSASSKTLRFKGRLYPQKVREKNGDHLTPRELEITKLLAEGKTNKEVASALNISVKTVETHRTNIMRKLEFRSMSELVRYAIRHQLVEA